MVENNKKISVILPIYNAEKYLKQCLDSIVNQTYQNLEIIIVNDGTKDNSMKIVEKYLQDKRIKIINKENGGPSSARNKGLEEATGEYISFIDNDDYLEKDIYESLINNLKDEDIIIFNFEYFNNNGIIKRGIELPEIYSSIKEGEKFLKKISNVCWNKLYRKEYVEKIRFYNGIIFEDILWTIETLLFCKKVKYIDKVGYYYRDGREGSIATSNKEKTLKAIDAYDKIVKYIDNLKKKNNIKLTITQKLRLEIEKIRMLRLLEKKIDIKELDYTFKEYLNLSREDIDFFKKQIQEILRYKNIIEINLLDKIYWKHRIYNFKIIRRILKNKIVNLLKK